MVTLDADLQEYLQDWTSHVNVKKEQVTQLNMSYTTWLAGAPINKDFPHCMLSLQDCNKIHEDFIEATDFLGKMYQTHEDLIVADPANCITHFKSCDEDLERVRKCFKRLDTFMASDNYFRSVSGLPPAPYLEQQPSQLALKQNNSDYLTTLARFRGTLNTQGH